MNIFVEDRFKNKHFFNEIAIKLNNYPGFIKSNWEVTPTLSIWYRRGLLSKVMPSYKITQYLSGNKTTFINRELLFNSKGRYKIQISKEIVVYSRNNPLEEENYLFQDNTITKTDKSPYQISKQLINKFKIIIRGGSDNLDFQIAENILEKGFRETQKEFSRLS